MDDKIKEAIDNLKVITEITLKTEKILNEIIQYESESDNNPENSWEKIAMVLQKHMGVISYNTWIKGLKAKKIDGNVLVLVAPNSYIKTYIEIKFLEDINKIGREILKDIIEIKIELEKD